MRSRNNDLFPGRGSVLQRPVLPRYTYHHSRSGQLQSITVSYSQLRTNVTGGEGAAAAAAA
eukprot:COSAG01_NODE_63629_length_279_cov_0.833333_1_plen_60_part_10